MEEGVLVHIDAGVMLEADIAIPGPADGLVLFAHGSGSSRHSPRNRMVAEYLRTVGLATVLTDLLTGEEEARDSYTAALRFDIPFLAERLINVIDWLGKHPDTVEMPLGLFGASTGAAAALSAAAQRPQAVQAIVSRGGRPDLATEFLPRVQAPVLLIVGSRDKEVLALNQQAAQELGGKQAVSIVPGATHLFEEPGTLEQVSRHAADWFRLHLIAGQQPKSPIR